MKRFPLLTPWNIGGGLCGLLLGVALLVSLVLHRRQIGRALAHAGARLFAPVGFFGLVMVVFLTISVLESGAFFNIAITHGAIAGLLGYALALGFDLVSVVCMQARLNATRLHDERGNRLNLLGVCICAAVSAFANVAGSLQGYNPVDLNRTPAWMSFSAPWVGLVFPTLMVMLSMTMDHILDHAPSRDIDVDTFRARERKRVDLLQVRLETERALLKLESELATLRREREQASGRVRREWVFWGWLRPVVPAPDQAATGRDDQQAEREQATQATCHDCKEERAQGHRQRSLGEVTLIPWMHNRNRVRTWAQRDKTCPLRRMRTWAQRDRTCPLRRMHTCAQRDRICSLRACALRRERT